jgi:tripartite-type tricarboxylate transporter receptor subunit TctC
MNVLRRRFLRMTATAAVALPFVRQSARAQTYPARPVRIIVGFAPAGTQDILARLISEWLSKRFGQTFVVENRPGASGNIATEMVVKAPADGHTLLLVASSAAINASLFEKLNFNFIRDVAPVAGISRAPLVMLVNPSVPAHTVPEFIAYAKNNPGKLNFASPGAGSVPHIAGELFRTMARLDIQHVPYRGGGPALTDLLAGQVQMMFSNSPILDHIKAGRLRPLAVSTTTPSKVLPDLPTVSESLPGFEASNWQGIGAPRNTPVEIIDALNRAINAALGDSKLWQQLAAMDGDVMIGSPGDFAKLIADETEMWGRVIRAAKIKTI